MGREACQRTDSPGAGVPGVEEAAAKLSEEGTPGPGRSSALFMKGNPAWLEHHVGDGVVPWRGESQAAKGPGDPSGEGKLLMERFLVRMGQATMGSIPCFEMTFLAAVGTGWVSDGHH